MFIIRQAEKRDLLSIHLNDTISYRTTKSGHKSMTMDWLQDFFDTFPSGICVAEESSSRVIVAHSMCFLFNSRWDEVDFNFLKSDVKVSSIHNNTGISGYGKSFVVLPEYRKYHLAYSIFKWMAISKHKQHPDFKYALALCESDRKSKKIHYAMGYKPKWVFNNMFEYDTGDVVDGILLEASMEHLYNGFTTGSFKKWFGVTGPEAEYIY